MMLPQLLFLVAVVGGAALLLGGGVWLWSRLERLEGRGPGGADGGRRLEEVRELREQLAATQDENRRLEERLDFLERLLEERDEPGDGDRRPGGGASDGID